MKKKIPQEEVVLSCANLRNYFSIGILNIFLKGLGYVVIESYFTYFYSEFLGVPAAIMATILTIGIVIDGVTDMGMGYVMDKVITRHGKAKHWLVWMGVPLGASMALIFFAPQNASITVKVIYAAVTYNLYCCCMTTVRIPSQSISSLSSDNDKVRGLFGWFSSNGSTLAYTVTSACLVPLLQTFGGESVYAFRMTQIVFSVVTAAVVIICGFTFHEKRNGEEWKAMRKEETSSSQAGGKSKNRGSFSYILRNKYWWVYLGFHFFESCVSGVLGGSLAYFCKYVLNDMTAVAMLMAVSSVPQLIGQLIVLPLMRFLENTKIGLLGFVLMTLGGFMGAIFGASSLALLQWSIMVRHFGLGMINGIRGSLLPRVVDYGEWKFGVRQDGMVQGGNSVMHKVTSALIAMLIGFALTLTGYTGGGEVVSSATVNIINFIFLKIPFYCSLIALLLYLRFDLNTEKIEQMRQEINARNYFRHV